MKFLIAATAILSTALAAPNPRLARRQCASLSDTTIIDVINNWQNDIATVNEFLDNTQPIGTAALLSQAKNALDFANDEPVELGTLASQCGSGCGCNADFTNAINSLMSQFSQVPQSLQTVIDNFGDAETVADAINTINQVRCCTVLPGAQTLFEQTAEGAGIFGSVNTNVPREQACATTAC